MKATPEDVAKSTMPWSMRSPIEPASMKATPEDVAKQNRPVANMAAVLMPQ